LHVRRSRARFFLRCGLLIATPSMSENYLRDDQMEEARLRLRKVICLVTMLTRLTNASVFRAVLRSNQRSSTASTIRTDLCSARINAAAAFTILWIHVLFLAVWAADEVAFLFGLRALILRILCVHIYLVARCNYREIKESRSLRQD
jgi:CDP-diglyceride synthetase